MPNFAALKKKRKKSYAALYLLSYALALVQKKILITKESFPIYNNSEWDFFFFLHNSTTWTVVLGVTPHWLAGVPTQAAFQRF